jgi:hypothetical protein
MRLALVVVSLWVGGSASDLPVPRSVTSQPAESVRTTSSGPGDHADLVPRRRDPRQVY